MAKGMAVLLASPSRGPMAEDGEMDDAEEAGSSFADSIEFSEMFKAFADSLGVSPKDEEASKRRLAALINIACDSMGHGY